MTACDVSVIIAAYNVENYIAKAIRSALDQDGVSLEVIVVNDHSTDATAKKAQEINDPRVKILQTPHNSGPGAARNIGIEHASGQWIAVLDGDDCFEETRLKNCLHKAAETNADIIVDNVTLCPEDGSPQTPMFPQETFNSLKEIDLSLFIHERLEGQGKYTLGYLKPVFSRAFLKSKNLSYNTTLPIGEDWLFLAQALAEGAKCAVEPSSGYLYTLRKGSISHRQSAQSLERLLQTDAAFLEKYEGKLTPKAAQSFTRRTAYTKERLAYTHLVEAIKQRNIKTILQVVRSNPRALYHLREPIIARLKKQS